MAPKIIKHRLFTWFEEVDSPVQPGTTVLAERIAHHGEEVDVTNDAHIRRGEELNAFYTDEEADAIRAGTYRGQDAEILYRRRAGITPQPQIEAIDDEGPQTQTLTTEELADYIKENNLSADQTVNLAGDDLESIERVLDAENIATDNDPRPDVVHHLEAKMRAATSGGGEPAPAPSKRSRARTAKPSGTGTTTG